jgi:hypothetical protein
VGLEVVVQPPARAARIEAAEQLSMRQLLAAYAAATGMRSEVLAAADGVLQVRARLSAASRPGTGARPGAAALPTGHRSLNTAGPRPRPPSNPQDQGDAAAAAPPATHIDFEGLEVEGFGPFQVGGHSCCQSAG